MRRPFIIQAARPSTSIPFFNLLLRLTLLSMVTATHYEHAQAFFDSIAGRGMLVARDSVDPDKCLRSGMEADEYYQVRLSQQPPE
jgi:Nucleoporin protein Ndc1-Nup